VQSHSVSTAGDWGTSFRLCADVVCKGVGTELNVNWTVKWGLTGTEHLQLFGLLPFCLQDLVTAEVQSINSCRPRDTLPVSDPSCDIVLAVGKMLAWYEAAKMDFFAESDVVALHEQGLELMQVIPGRVSKSCGVHSSTPGSQCSL
jgi:hypothetical protein